MSEAQVAKQEIAPQYQLSEGVKLVLDRMESNPEEFEFEVGEGKWGNMIAVVHERMFSSKTVLSRPLSEPWLNKYEVEAIWQGYVKVQQSKFHRFVMKNILDDKENDEFAEAIKKFQTTQPLNNLSLSPHHNTLQNSVMPPGGIGYYNAAQGARSATTGIAGTVSSEHTTDASSYFAQAKRALGFK